MKTDRKLLDLAAKAADVRFGFDGKEYADTPGACWNPLTDDGDALRLAVKLCMNIEVNDDYVYACANGNYSEPAKPDRVAAIRRAIVRAAAAIGEAAHGD